MEKCLKEVGGKGHDPEYERNKRAELVQQYEESIKRTPQEVPYGIKGVNMSCAYPVHIGGIKSAECKEDDEGTEHTNFKFLYKKYLRFSSKIINFFM